MAAAPDALLRACDGRVADAAEDDAVDRVPARWVVRPTCTEHVSEVLKTCSTSGLRVVVRGSGTKLRWGSPPEQVDVVLDTTGLDRLVEHAAGDLIVVSEAGRRLQDLQHDVGLAGQRLGIDPPRQGTVGGAVAAATTGPLRLHHGGVRDLVIGMTMVRADGVVAKSGGKVVKNVAGYDLGKLMAGSFGTLGVITQVAFRLHPVPAGRRWVSVPVWSPDSVHRAVQAVVHSQLMPVAVELDRGEAEGGQGRGNQGEGMLALALEGHPGAVAALGGRAADLLAAACDGAEVEVSETAPVWWGREPEAAGGCLAKVTFAIGKVGAMLAALDATTARADGVRARLRGSPAVGTTLLGLTGPAEQVARVVAELRSEAPTFTGSVVVHEAVPGVMARTDPWGPVRGLGLMRAVKDQFDPQRLLAPGRFVGGI